MFFDKEWLEIPQKDTYGRKSDPGRNLLRIERDKL